MTMAKRLRKEYISLEIAVNSSPAQKAILDLEKENRKLVGTQTELYTTIKQLEGEQKKIRRAYERTNTQLKNVRAEKERVNTSYEDELQKLKRLENSLGRNDQAYKQQERIVNQLGREKAKLTTQEEKLAIAENKMSRQLKLSSSQIGKLRKDHRLLGNEVQQNNIKIDQLTKEMRLSDLTTEQLAKKAKHLRFVLSKMADSPARRKLAAELGEVNAQMTRLNAQANIQRLTWSSAANWLNKYQTMLIGFVATVTGVVFTFQRWIDYSGTLADSMADVMKTTGMTKESVEDLLRSFNKLDTRTSKLDLLSIAEEGGRIGIRENEMESFVGVIDKAAVALGDSFTGGVSEVTSVLGRLRFLFQETADMGVEDALNAIGSALNELGYSGVATEKNIAEFATRLGSLPNQLKPSVAEALALGAAFEESGIKAEVSSRAYTIFLNRAARNTEEFAKVMRISTQEAEELLNTDPVEFFLQFGEALGSSNVSATQMSAMLQEMGINADGANKIVGAISNSTQRFRDQINLANKAIAEGTSLTDEFNVKNNTLQATLEKINKTLTGWFTSDTIINSLEEIIVWFAKLIGATEDADGSGERWRNNLILLGKIILIVATGIVSYNGALKLNAIWLSRARQQGVLWAVQLRLQNALLLLQQMRIGMVNVAQALFTGGIRAAIVELRAMSLAMGVTPWAAFAAGIGVVLAAYHLLIKSQEDVITNEKILGDAFLEAEKSIQSQVNEIEQLMKVAKDLNVEEENRIKAINRLNEIMPGYNDALSLEKINTLEAASAVKAYTEELRKNARVKALQSKIDELEREKLDTESKTSKDYRSRVDKVFDGFWGLFGVETNYHQSVDDLEESLRNSFPDMSEKDFQKALNSAIKQSGLDKKVEELSDIDSQIEFLQDELIKLMKEGSGLGGDVELEEFDVTPTKQDDKSKQERERRIEELKRENERLANELLQIRRNIEDAQFAVLEDSFEKELDLLNLQHKRRIEDLKAQIVDESVIEALEREKAKHKGDRERIALIDEMIAKIHEKNLELNNSILQSEVTHQHAIGRLHVQYAQKRLDSLQKEIEAARKERETAFNQELLELGSFEAVKERLAETLSKKELRKITTWEQAKQALRNEYNEQALEEEIEFNQRLLEEMQTAWELGAFGDFNIELMTEEEKLTFLDTIEELKAKLIELGVAKADLQSNTVEGSGETYGMGGAGDILGMTPENWLKFFENIQDGIYGLEELAATVGLLQSAFNQFFQSQNQAYQRDLRMFEGSVRRKEEAPRKQLDNNIISQEKYDRELKKLQDKAEKQREEMQYKAAMQQYKQDIMNAISGTALMIINAAKTDPFVPLGLRMTGVAATMRAMQLSTIKKNKPIKGFEEGFYKNFPVQREQDGKMFNASFGGNARSGEVRTPTVFMAGENGVEMILDNKTYKTLPSDIAYGLHQHIARVKGFETGLYPSAGADMNFEEVNEMIAQTNELLTINNSLLSAILEKDEYAKLVMDYEAMRKFKRVEDEYIRHVNKNKV